MLDSLWRSLRKVGEWLQSPLLLLVRLYWGYQFAATGLGKLVNLAPVVEFFSSLSIPYPQLNAVLAGSIEFIGGILLIFGLFARVAAIPLIIVMLTAYATAHAVVFPELFEKFNLEPFLAASPFLFLFVALLIFCFGPGKISLDYLWSGARQKREMP